MTVPIANFHGLGPLHPWVEADEARYWLPAAAFELALDLLCASGRDFAVSFDDGNLSDYVIAMPALQARCLPGSFFVCADRIGQPGYLGEREIRAMAAAGFTIGTHGAAHTNWRAQDDSELAREVDGAITRIAKILGQPVTTAGIPFGEYDRRVLSALAAAGITRTYSSDGAPRLCQRGVQPRLSLRSDRDVAAQVAQLLRRRSWVKGLLRELRLVAKSLR